MLNQMTFKKKQRKTKSQKKNKGNWKFSHARLRLQFSHLNDHKFRQCFSDIINLMCACGTEVETTEYLVLRCHFYSTQRLELSENLEFNQIF